ncbi:MAG: MFS transporter [Fidelibacterota bacterium]|nr:MAG: MFS transporter [Candidatus Neomarinimicrobiota bacterium]
MYKHSLVFSSACLGLLVFGIVMTVMGAILPSVLDKFEVSKASAGSLFVLMSFGIMIGSLVFGPIVDRFGYQYLLIAGAGLILLGLEGIAFSPYFHLLRLSAFFVGFGGGIINGGGNALVADISEEGRSAGLSLLGVFYGIGAISVPLILGSLLELRSYETILAVVGLAVGLPLLYFVIIRFPIPKQDRGFPIREGVGLLKKGPLLLFGFILFFQSGMEITVGGWSAAFFNEELAIGTGQSVLYLSFYWIGMIVARLILGIILKQISPALVLRISLAIAFTGSLLMLFSTGVGLALIGLLLIGAGFAASYPVILGYIGDQYPTLSGTAFSIALVIALAGGMILPYLAGIIGNVTNLRVSFTIVPVATISIAILLSIVLARISITPDSA